jgi:myo-inositol-1(or 4)-monophosphatase
VLEADLRDLAIDVATTAAASIGDAVARDVGTKSSATDMVTEVDRASEALIVERLHAARPDDGVFGEEGARAPGSSGVRWIIDPLDGTTNFLYRFPAYSVSIAAEVDGEVVAGAVHDLVHGETFAAARGHGSTCNGRPLRVTGATTLATALLATGFGYDPEQRVQQAGVLARLLGHIRDIRRGGSAALDLCWVGAGRVDGYYEAGLNEWDLAAGRLVAAEAGAWVGMIDDVTVAIAPQLADAFAAALADALKS